MGLTAQAKNLSANVSGLIENIQKQINGVKLDDNLEASTARLSLRPY